MKINKLTLESSEFPTALRGLPASPKVLYQSGASLNRLLERPSVTLVGNRKMTVYGERITAQLARELAYQGVIIVSGLAFGVDAAAHQAAIESGGLCIAVLPGPLDRILPASNEQLAEQILKQGGALVSEYAPGEQPFKQNFVARNRIMSGLGWVTVITEAGQKSGALHTARFALEQGKTVMAVPGNVYHEGSVGVHNLLKSGAGLVTETQDVLNALGIQKHSLPPREIKGRNRNEQTVLDLMLKGMTDGADLLEASQLSASHFSQALTMLEIGGQIKAMGGNHWALY